jgi:hypothetical protein
LVQRIADHLEPQSPHQAAVSLASVYVIAPARPGLPRQPSQRVSAFLRWGARYETDAVVGAISMAAARARRQLNDIIALAEPMLASFYDLEKASDSALREALMADPDALPLLEQRYICAEPVSQWLRFVHVQPALDILLRQPGAAALSIRMERTAAEHTNGRSPLQLRVLALGAACQADVLEALANEFRGRGIVVTDPAEAHLLPAVDWFSMDTAEERDDIMQRSSRPTQPGEQCGVDLGLTSADIAHLFPLPMPLYDE